MIPAILGVGEVTAIVTTKFHNFSLDSAPGFSKEEEIERIIQLCPLGHIRHKNEMTVQAIDYPQSD